MGDLTLAGIIHGIVATILSFDLLLTKHRPVSAVLWLGVVWTLPYAGAIAYVSFGVDRVRTGARRRAESNALLQQRAALHPTFEGLTVDSMRRLEPEMHPALRIFKATDSAVRRNRVLKGHEVDLLVDGDRFFPAFMEAAAAAKESVHLQTFIFGRDRTGQEFLDVLMERARAGVDVRVLYDRFGSTWAHLGRFFQPARKAGVRVCSITQAHPLKGRFQINLRNHRKVAVVDGRIGFVGGINIHDGHRSGYLKEVPIRDYHVRMRGPAVADLQFQFIEDWFFASREHPDALLNPAHFPPYEESGAGLVQVVPGGPHPGGNAVADVFFAAIASAERSLVIVTPYFIPDEPIVQALRYAVFRGVDVRLVVPKVGNHRYAEFASRALYAPLLRSGVRIFERRPPFIHAKALVVDGIYALMGSANLDYRSLHLNFETNLEVAEEGFVAAVTRQVEEEIAQSDEVRPEVHRARPLVRRLAENFCYLFQPML
jgi:cardiolipin synthase